MTRPISLHGFEAKFAEVEDPWACRSSVFEALKRRRALAGAPLVGTALDVACGDGAGTLALSARALRVEALDGAERALASARRLLGPGARVRFRRARLPRELPPGRWRRILVAELVYYLAPHEIEALAEGLAQRVSPGGELIAVHHTVPFSDARTPPSRAAAIFHRSLARRLQCRERRPFGRYVVSRWRRRRMRNRRAANPTRVAPVGLDAQVHQA